MAIVTQDLGIKTMGYEDIQRRIQEILNKDTGKTLPRKKNKKATKNDR